MSQVKDLIYDSRNFICSYSGQEVVAQLTAIYDSRNFICSYSKQTMKKTTKTIYDSRNFICSYSCCWQKCCISVRYKSICSKNYSK